MGRHLPSVIKAVVSLIPSDYPKREALLEAFRKIISSHDYSAPELYSLWWNQAVDACLCYLGVPDTDWKLLIIEVFADRRDYREFLVLGASNEF
jgi:hypothetical protein